jgi:acetyl esterase/lipase
MLMVHGGGWVRGNKALWRVVRNKVMHWVGKGYLFVSTNYRLVPDVDPLTQADDVARALAFVQSRLGDWHGDASRIALAGHSAGGHLVALLTADGRIATRQGAATWRAAIAIDCAALDVERIMRRHHFPLYDTAFSDDPGYWVGASPVHRIAGPLVAPMLLVCSMQRPESCLQADAFAARAKEVGSHVDLLPVEIPHAQTNDMLGARGPYTDHVDAFMASVGMP